MFHVKIFYFIISQLKSLTMKYGNIAILDPLFSLAKSLFFSVVYVICRKFVVVDICHDAVSRYQIHSAVHGVSTVITKVMTIITILR